MEIICPGCSALNRLHNKSCPACRTQLSITFATKFRVEDQVMTLQSLFEEVRMLKLARSETPQAQQQNLTAWRKQQEQQQRNLRARLDMLETRLEQRLQRIQQALGIEEEPQAEPIVRPEPVGNLSSDQDLVPELQPEEEKVPPIEPQPEKLPVSDKTPLPKKEPFYIDPIPVEPRSQEQKPQVEYRLPARDTSEVRLPEPSAATPAWLSDLFAPLRQLSEFVSATYQSYKSRNQLPLFFLLLAGISAMLFGVGFLVRYSANTWFGALALPAKAAIGFGLIGAVIGLGVWLLHGKTYRSIGSSVAGMGIALNDLFLYFLSDELAPQWGFGLIALNSLLGAGLALGYKTRTVALVSLVAGALSPLYLESTGQGTELYFGYLWILCAVSVLLAQRMAWEPLKLIALLLSGCIIGGSIYVDTAHLNQGVQLALYHAFAYLFTYAALFDGIRLRQELRALHLSLLLGAQLAIVFVLSYQLGYKQPQYQGLGLAYLLNSLPFAALFLVARSRLDSKGLSLSLAFVAGYWLFGIASLAQVDQYGVFWGIESLVFIALGYGMKLPFARRLGYLLLTLSSGFMLYGARLIYTEWQLHLSPIGLTNMLSLGAVLAMAWGLQLYLKGKTQILESLLALWAVWVYFTLGLYWGEQYALNAAVLPLFALLYWGARRSLPAVELLGALHFIAIMAVVVWSVLLTGSMRFPLQPLYGKIGFVELVAVLWLPRLFYQILLPAGTRQQEAWAARLISYLVLAAIPTNMAYSEFPEYVSYFAWGSVALSFVFSELTRHVALGIEFYAFILLASVLTLYQQDYGAMPLGIAALFGAFFYKKGYERSAYETSFYKLAFTYAFFYPGLCLMTVQYGLGTPRWDLPVIWLGVYSVLIAQLRPLVYALHAAAPVAYRLGWSVWALGLAVVCMHEPNSAFPWTALEKGLLHGVCCLFLGTVFLQTYKLNYLANRIFDLPLVHLSLAFYYAFAYYDLTGDPLNLLLTITLVVHGVSLVLHTLLPKSKSLIYAYLPMLLAAIAKLFFWDMRNAPTVHRILAFIGVGAIFLLAAFFFVRYTSVKKEDVQEPAAEPEPPQDDAVA